GRHDVRGCQVKIQADRAETDPKVFTKIIMHFIVTGVNLPETAVARAIQMSHEKYCSASIMIGKTAEITTSFEVTPLPASPAPCGGSPAGPAEPDPWVPWVVLVRATKCVARYSIQMRWAVVVMTLAARRIRPRTGAGKGAPPACSAASACW